MLVSVNSINFDLNGIAIEFSYGSFVVMVLHINFRKSIEIDLST